MSSESARGRSLALSLATAARQKPLEIIATKATMWQARSLDLISNRDWQSRITHRFWPLSLPPASNATHTQFHSFSDH